jgi:hypothetical protein
MESEAPRAYRQLLEAVPLEVREAVADVDRTLIRLSLQQSPMERLRAAHRMAEELMKLRDAAASQRR